MKGCVDRGGEIIDGMTKCMYIVEPQSVTRALQSYYEGNALQARGIPAALIKKPLLKIVTNARYLGGAERSVLEIASMASSRGHRVEIIPRGANSVPEFTRYNISNNLTGECDVLLVYASDMAFDFHKPEFEIFKSVRAKRKVMALTYKLGKAGLTDWTREFDVYLFLSSTMRDQFCKQAQTLGGPIELDVLAPPVDTSKLLEIEPEYDGTVRVLRHSSQGDAKYPDDLPSLIDKMPDQNFVFMPQPKKLRLGGLRNLECYAYNSMPVEHFLSKGNCYWYLLPDGYTDQGPRAIVEAMAAGLPVIAENRDGAKDRVTEETGWLVNHHEESVAIINSLTPDMLAKKGMAARERAMSEFAKSKWIDAILGD
jgi:hypothetical protein